MSRKTLALALGLLLAAAACRADAGDPDPALLEGWENPEGFFPEPIEGPDPFVEGEMRLGVGLFYEGGLSDFVPIDGSFSNYYIFEAYPGGPLTFTQLDDERTLVEGLNSARLTHAGLTFWGGGVFWSEARDLSRWTRLYVSLKSSAESFETINLGVQADDADFTVPASDYGYAADGEWHHLEIPLADLVAAGADPTAITAPFLFGGGAGTAGHVLYIDAVYWTDE